MAPSLRHSQEVLPNPRMLVLERVERGQGQFRLFVTAMQEPVCPACGRVSRSLHSCYGRCLQDLPWQGLSVKLYVTAHRYRCRNTDCPQKVFCERLPDVACRYARQTNRTSEIIRLVGYIAGGRPGERLLIRLAIRTSDDTVLRRVKQPTQSTNMPIRNLGVDDWAWCKGQDYGTILVDLDLHRVADLLPDRSSESFSCWLQQHSGIAIIARDRCGLYAEGAALGAPNAQQVADRFHLVLNLSTAVERVFEEHRRELILPPECEPETTDEAQKSNDSSPGKKDSAEVKLQQQRRERRLDRYERVVDLFTKGFSQRWISREVGIGRKTVRRWLTAGQFPERKPPHRKPAQVTSFAEYLQRRWNEGCHNATRLYQEIRQAGYAGKRSMVASFVSTWRRTGKPKAPDKPRRIAPKHAAILTTRASDQMTEEQQKLFDRIGNCCPDAFLLRSLALDFRAAMASCEAPQMVAWMDVARRSGFGPLVRFAYGLQKDVSAINAAVETSWSTGQVEGQINRLKTIKRQMYGRSGFALLRARVLPYEAAIPRAAGPAP